MKLSKHVLPATLILTFGFFTFTSCEKNANGNPDDGGNTGGGNEDSTQVEPPVQEKPVLYPENTDTIKVANKGGMFSFSYVLENPVEGIKTTATSVNDWISEITCPGNGTVSFNVSPNQEYTGREGSIRVEYPYSETEEPLYFETIIVQDATPEPEIQYDIELEGKMYGQYMGQGRADILNLPVQFFPDRQRIQRRRDRQAEQRLYPHGPVQRLRPRGYGYNLPSRRDLYYRLQQGLSGNDIIRE